jgi:hypothetical protein
VRRIISKWILKKQNGRVWTGFICLRIGISGSTKCWKISWLAEKLLTSLQTFRPLG